MKTLLVCGPMHEIFKAYGLKKLELVNSDDPLTLGALGPYLQDRALGVDLALITDDAFDAGEALPHSARHIADLLRWSESANPDPLKVLILTNNPALKTALAPEAAAWDGVSVHVCEWLRLPKQEYEKAIEAAVKAPKALRREAGGGFPKWFERKKTPAPEPEDPALNKQLQTIGRALNRVLFITGHRGSGVSSTAANLAHVAVRQGLSVMLADFDVDYRAVNLYFSAFHNRAAKDEDINASLARSLARPDAYATTAVNAEGLWLTSLGYSFQDAKLLEHLYRGPKIIAWLTVMRQHFNLVVADMPLDALRGLGEVVVHADALGLCVPNNLYAVASTLRNLETALDPDGIRHLNAKAKLVVTQYNSMLKFQGEFFTPDKVAQVLTSLSDSFPYPLKVAGAVPWVQDFDTQVENDIPIAAQNAQCGKAYKELLLRFMEGVQ